MGQHMVSRWHAHGVYALPPPPPVPRPPARWEGAFSAGGWWWGGEVLAMLPGRAKAWASKAKNGRQGGG